MDKMVRSVCKLCRAPIWLLAGKSWVPEFSNGGGGSLCFVNKRYPCTHVPRKEVSDEQEA